VKNFNWVSFLIGVLVAWFGVPLVQSLLAKAKG
jgi:predicted membrane channel-forming protein YqfA (hemolysin III family)